MVNVQYIYNTDLRRSPVIILEVSAPPPCVADPIADHRSI